MMKYLVVIEKANENYSAHVPDLPGCVATGTTPQETKANIKEAIQLHIKGLLEDHSTIPKPTTSHTYVTIASTDK